MTKNQKATYEQIHFALQYLATAGKSFLEHQPDDSHTNLGFNPENNTIETWKLDERGSKLGLDLNDFSLNWIDKNLKFPLNGETHTTIVAWLIATASKIGLTKIYAFDLHYELPFKWNNTYKFHVEDKIVLRHEIRIRTLANRVLELFLNQIQLQSTIRIWPHHFDTGAFVVLDDGSGKSIGMGMAIPDALVNDHYFYISGYCGHDNIDTNTLKKMSLGGWKNEGFKGAVLPVGSVNVDKAVQFLGEAFEKLTQ
ncbi:MAG: hypothetical protein AAF039_03820 [Bacteroidota bacterium]